MTSQDPAAAIPTVSERKQSLLCHSSPVKKKDKNNPLLNNFSIKPIIQFFNKKLKKDPKQKGSVKVERRRKIVIEKDFHSDTYVAEAGSDYNESQQSDCSGDLDKVYGDNKNKRASLYSDFGDVNLTFVVNEELYFRDQDEDIGFESDSGEESGNYNEFLHNDEERENEDEIFQELIDEVGLVDGLPTRPAPTVEDDDISQDGDICDIADGSEAESDVLATCAEVHMSEKDTSDPSQPRQPSTISEFSCEDSTQTHEQTISQDDTKRCETIVDSSVPGMVPAGAVRGEYRDCAEIAEQNESLEPEQNIANSVNLPVDSQARDQAPQKECPGPVSPAAEVNDIKEPSAFMNAKDEAGATDANVNEAKCITISEPLSEISNSEHSCHDNESISSATKEFNTHGTETKYSNEEFESEGGMSERESSAADTLLDAVTRDDSEQEARCEASEAEADLREEAGVSRIAPDLDTENGDGDLDADADGDAASGGEAAAAADTGNNDIGKSSHGSHSDEKLVKLTEPQPSQAQAPTEASQQRPSEEAVAGEGEEGGPGGCHTSAQEEDASPHLIGRDGDSSGVPDGGDNQTHSPVPTIATGDSWNCVTSSLSSAAAKPPADTETDAAAVETSSDLTTDDCSVTRQTGNHLETMENVGRGGELINGNDTNILPQNQNCEENESSPRHDISSMKYSGQDVTADKDDARADSKDIIDDEADSGHDSNSDIPENISSGSDSVETCSEKSQDTETDRNIVETDDEKDEGRCEDTQTERLQPPSDEIRDFLPDINSYKNFGVEDLNSNNNKFVLEAPVPEIEENLNINENSTAQGQAEHITPQYYTNNLIEKPHIVDPEVDVDVETELSNFDSDTVSELDMLDTTSEYAAPYTPLSMSAKVTGSRIPRITRSNSLMSFKNRRCSLQSLPLSHAHHCSRRSSVSSRRSSTISIDERLPWNYGAGGSQYQKMYPFGKRKRLSVDNYYD